MSFQFIGRNPLLKGNEYSKKSGYFVEVYGKKRAFLLEDDDLNKGDSEFYIGYDSEFALERRIEKIIDHYNGLYFLSSRPIRQCEKTQKQNS